MKFVVPFIAAAALASGASAAFTMFSTEASTNVQGNSVFKVYANFDAQASLLNAFQIVAGAGTLDVATAIHNDFVGGSWAPQFSAAAGNDSYLLIGGLANFGNSTNADPAFGAAGFNQLTIPNGAGWFNGNPPNGQGASIAGKTQIGQFVFAPGAVLEFRTFSLKVGYNAGLGTPTVFGQGEFTIGIPAPGAIALLGLAGLAGRRRRA